MHGSSATLNSPANRSIAPTPRSPPGSRPCRRLPRPSRASRRRPGRAMDSSSSRGAAPETKPAQHEGRTARTSRRWRTGSPRGRRTGAPARPARPNSSSPQRSPQRGFSAGRRPASPGSEGQRRDGLKRPVPAPRAGQRDRRGKAVDDSDAEERRATHDVRDDQAVPSRPPVGGGSEDRSEQHGRRRDRRAGRG